MNTNCTVNGRLIKDMTPEERIAFVERWTRRHGPIVLVDSEEEIERYRKEHGEFNDNENK